MKSLFLFKIKAFDFPESCLAIAQGLDSIPDIFVDSGLGHELDTHCLSEASHEPAAFCFLENSPGKQSNGSFGQSTAEANRDESMDEDSLAEENDEPSGLSHFIRRQSVDSSQDLSNQDGDETLSEKPQAPSGLNNYDLSDDTVNEIFARSCSVVNFATNLMLYLFTESELLACTNVYGRQVKTLSSQKGAGALDAERVEAIRLLVEQKSPKKIWKTCVVTMNIKIWTIKDRAKQEK